jgi:hypothetical protein
MHGDQIVAVAPDDGQAWRRLANILIAIPPAENDDGGERYERATTAAYIAYQKATTPKDEADALITLASAMHKTDFRAEGLTLKKMGLGGGRQHDIFKVMREGF